MWTRIRPAGCTATGAPGMLRVGVSACGRHEPESMPLSGQRPAVRGGAPFRGVAAKKKKLNKKRARGISKTERQLIHGIRPNRQIHPRGCPFRRCFPALSAPGGSHAVVRRPASADSALSDDLGPAPARLRTRSSRTSLALFQHLRRGKPRIEPARLGVSSGAQSRAETAPCESAAAETVLGAAGDAAGPMRPRVPIQRSRRSGARGSAPVSCRARLARTGPLLPASAGGRPPLPRDRQGIGRVSRRRIAFAATIAGAPRPRRWVLTCDTQTFTFPTRTSSKRPMENSRLEKWPRCRPTWPPADLPGADAGNRDHNCGFRPSPPAQSRGKTTACRRGSKIVSSQAGGDGELLRDSLVASEPA